MLSVAGTIELSTVARLTLVRGLESIEQDMEVALADKKARDDAKTAAVLAGLERERDMNERIRQTAVEKEAAHSRARAARAERGRLEELSKSATKTVSVAGREMARQEVAVLGALINEGKTVPSRLAAIVQLDVMLVREHLKSLRIDGLAVTGRKAPFGQKDFYWRPAMHAMQGNGRTGW